MSKATEYVEQYQYFASTACASARTAFSHFTPYSNCFTKKMTTQYLPAPKARFYRNGAEAKLPPGARSWCHMTERKLQRQCRLLSQWFEPGEVLLLEVERGGELEFITVERGRIVQKLQTPD